MTIPHWQVVFELSARQSVNHLTGALVILQTAHFFVLLSTMPCNFCSISGNQWCGVILVGIEIRLELLRQAVAGARGGLQTNFWFSMEMSAYPQTLPTLRSYGAPLPVPSLPSHLLWPFPFPQWPGSLYFSPLPRPDRKKLPLLLILRAAALGGHRAKLTDCKMALRVLCQLNHHRAIPWQLLTSSSLIQPM